MLRSVVGFSRSSHESRIWGKGMLSYGDPAESQRFRGGGVGVPFGQSLSRNFRRLPENQDNEIILLAHYRPTTPKTGQNSTDLDISCLMGASAAVT